MSERVSERKRRGMQERVREDVSEPRFIGINISNENIHSNIKYTSMYNAYLCMDYVKRWAWCSFCINTFELELFVEMLIIYYISTFSFVMQLCCLVIERVVLMCAIVSMLNDIWYIEFDWGWKLYIVKKQSLKSVKRSSWQIKRTKISHHFKSLVGYWSFYAKRKRQRTPLKKKKRLINFEIINYKSVTAMLWHHSFKMIGENRWRRLYALQIQLEVPSAYDSGIYRKFLQQLPCGNER